MSLWEAKQQLVMVRCTMAYSTPWYTWPVHLGLQCQVGHISQTQVVHATRDLQQAPSDSANIIQSQHVHAQTVMTWYKLPLVNYAVRHILTPESNLQLVDQRLLLCRATQHSS